MGIELRKIRKTFADGTVAVDNLDLAFEHGEFIVLVGPSGSGKTTACRILAGLELPTSGQVLADGRDITHVPPRKRQMSMVFQNYALYGHKSVYENIAYPLRVRKWRKDQIDGLVREAASMVGLDHLLKRKPRELSGGEAQRVAVARALVWSPRLCLMDEPLSNLDELLRLQTRTQLKRLHQELGKTFVMVTHDQEQAMVLGTRIGVMRKGKLMQFDQPRRIYHQPANRFVAEFIGRPAMNTLDGVIENGVFRAGSLAVPLHGGDGDVAQGWPAAEHAGPIVLGIRPEQIQLVPASEAHTLAMTIDVVEAVEPDTLLYLRAEGVSLVVRVTRELPSLAPGQVVHIALPRQQLHFFDADTGARLGS